MTPTDLALALNASGRFSVLVSRPTGNGQSRGPRLRLQVGPLDGASAHAIAEGIGEGAHTRRRDSVRDRWRVEVRGPRVEELGLEVVDRLDARATASFTAALDRFDEVRARRAGAR